MLKASNLFWEHRQCPHPFFFLCVCHERKSAVSVSLHWYTILIEHCARESHVSYLQLASGLFLTSGGETCRHSERQGAATPAAAARAADSTAQQRLHLGKPGWSGDPLTTVFGCRYRSQPHWNDPRNVTLFDFPASLLLMSLSLFQQMNCIFLAYVDCVSVKLSRREWCVSQYKNNSLWSRQSFKFWNVALQCALKCKEL